MSKNLVFYSTCRICGNEKTYKTKQGYIKGLKSPCRSCANSISGGGIGHTKYCKCGELKYKKSSTYCYKHHLEQRKKYTQDYRFRQYGVTRDWYLEEVKKCCKICGTKLSANSKVKRNRGHIDHDHKTNKVRGVLCDLCNKGLGQFKDSIESLEKAIIYLKNNNKKDTIN